MSPDVRNGTLFVTKYTDLVSHAAEQVIVYVGTGELLDVDDMSRAQIYDTYHLEVHGGGKLKCVECQTICNI